MKRIPFCGTSSFAGRVLPIIIGTSYTTTKNNHLRMKRTLLILVLTGLISWSANAQLNDKGKIGITYSLNGGTSVIQNSDLIGAASHDVTNASGIGLIYLKPINNWLEWETGLTYTLFKVTTTSAPTPEVFTKNSTISLIDIPIGLRAGFLKYFFVNGGLMLDLDTMSDSPVNSQSGIGMMLGLGVKYDFKFGGSLFVNPYGKIHSLLPFGTNNNHERILESGWKLGITYKL